MAKIPIKFKRVAAAFNEAAKWRQPCEDSSSGSEYWPESGGASLSDLVNSFIEKGDGLDPFEIMDMDMDTDMNVARDNKEQAGYESDGNYCGSDSEEDYIEKKELLRGFLLECKCDKGVKQKILHEVQVALKLFGGNDNIVDSNTSRSGVKRNVMSHLRDKGFDAGLCKSRWEKTGRYPAGTFEYIDVVICERRYMIELFMSEELEIVRPTTRYTSLLDMIPSILITKNAQVLKKIIRLMSAAMKDSLKQSDMYVAPWRRNGYMQARYFSPYKRTTNRDSTAKLAKEELAKKRTTKVGFEADLPRVPYYCRDDGFASKVKRDLRVGLLAAALQGR